MCKWEILQIQMIICACILNELLGEHYYKLEKHPLMHYELAIGTLSICENIVRRKPGLKKSFDGKVVTGMFWLGRVV